jgi:uncharacterized protein (DUF433 family)
MTFDRIVSRPGVLAGKPCIRGTRISVELVLELIAGGASIDDIAKAYPHLPREDVEQAVRYAAQYFGHEAMLEVEVSQ